MLPREKFNQFGVSSLSLENLVAIILSTGSTKENVYQLSSRVCKQFKQGVISYDQLRNLNGLGDVKAMKLICSVELGTRLMSKEDALQKVITSSQAYETLKYIAKYKQEHVVCIFLNARYEVLGKKTLGIGTVDSVNILPRDIILKALHFNSTGVIMAHNHPSGDITASVGDIQMTKRIKNAMDIVGINLLDHIIISSRGWGSVVIE